MIKLRVCQCLSALRKNSAFDRAILGRSFRENINGASNDPSLNAIRLAIPAKEHLN